MIENLVRQDEADIVAFIRWYSTTERLFNALYLAILPSSYLQASPLCGAYWLRMYVFLNCAVEIINFVEKDSEAEEKKIECVSGAKKK